MQFSSVLFLTSAALAAHISGYSNGTDSTITYETTVEQVVTAFTTYCPGATQITTNGKTYTVTGATTLTITDCPCTVKSTLTTTGVATSASVTAASASSKSVVASSSSGSSAAPSLTTAEGVAAKVDIAGLAAIAGVAAYLL
ncbi:unnamed protein product [Ambrosiozyma monospora]|uniref:Unnamed protein product n=1 Tax=Ambrosiozyma monospora TaxID=43982 RepID=A0A9W7DFA3_AMBMO|nr:unnamed protein product [Ambrosiozyma monospora]